MRIRFRNLVNPTSCNSYRRKVAEKTHNKEHKFPSFSFIQHTRNLL